MVVCRAIALICYAAVVVAAAGGLVSPWFLLLLAADLPLAGLMGRPAESAESLRYGLVIDGLVGVPGLMAVVLTAAGVSALV